MLDFFIDSNEASQNPDIANYLKKKCPVIIKHLPCGDYYCPPILIERKAAGDFLGSMASGHLQEQLSRMTEQTGVKNILLIEGSVSKELKWRKFSNASVNGIFNSLLFGKSYESIKIMPTDDREHTRSWLLSVYQDLIKTKEYTLIPLRVKKKVRSMRDKQRFLCEGYAGVGAITAINLLTKFGSPRNLMNATLEELRKIPKVGPKTAQRIFDVNNSKFKEAK